MSEMEDMIIQQGSQLLLTLGGSGVAGFVMGYAIKKVLKIMAFVAGGIIALLAFLEFKQVISVHWATVANESYNLANTSLHTVGNMANMVSDKMDAANGLIIGGSVFAFMGSFVLGLKKG